MNSRYLLTVYVGNYLKSCRHHTTKAAFPSPFWGVRLQYFPPLLQVFLQFKLIRLIQYSSLVALRESEVEMDLKAEIERLIQNYEKHLKNCESIIQESQSSKPEAYKEHQVLKKFWIIVLNDFRRLADIANHERSNNKKRKF